MPSKLAACHANKNPFEEKLSAKHPNKYLFDFHSFKIVSGTLCLYKLFYLLKNKRKRGEIQ